MALTDHDSIAGVAGARTRALQLGLDVVAGVELSAREADRETHILGLHLADLNVLETVLLRFRGARVERARLILARLRELGMDVPAEDVLREGDTGAIGRPHVARALVQRGYVPDVRAAFDRYLGAGRPAYVPKEALSVAAAVELIHRAGGIAVLAHPGADGTLARVAEMKSAGMDGVEVRHPGHSAEDVARLAAIADHLGLVMSGGSDWHGGGDNKRRLGGQEVPFEWMQEQLRRAGIVRGF
jgi:hypothetical protein